MIGKNTDWVAGILFFFIFLFIPSILFILSNFFKLAENYRPLQCFREVVKEGVFLIPR